MLREQSVKVLRERLTAIARLVELEYQDEWVKSLSKDEILGKLERIRNQFRK